MSSPTTVGIVGGGIAGLYTALLLKREGVKFHIFEGTGNVGGRVHTHYFSTEKDQYYEAGAMRIPESVFHKITFSLIDYLNQLSSEDKRIDLIDYIISMPGNEVYVNGVPPMDVSITSVTPVMVKWNVPDKFKNHSTQLLMKEAIGVFQDRLIKAIEEGRFEEEFRSIIRELDNYSFRAYLIDVMQYPTSVIDFMETVLSQTNQFALSVPELIMQNLDFGEQKWKTIDKGMSRLPEAMAALVGYDNITYGARVNSLALNKDGRVTVIATGYNGQLEVQFDKVVLAVPPAALKMLMARPRWGPEKEMAIRSIHFEALYKMGMRFKYRFWEKVGQNPSKGGQSTTDLPIRWVVFPSNGIGSDGPGVLLVYAWMTDSTTWVPLTPIERRSLAIHNLEELYKGRLGKDKDGKLITVESLLMETSDVVWSMSTATGDAMFLPGQFLDRFDPARQPEGNIYFAGEHLSFHHTWISGAADSALQTTRDLLKKPDLPPLSPGLAKTPLPRSPEHHHLEFTFYPSNPLFLQHLAPQTIFYGGYPREDEDERSVQRARLPNSLGDGSLHPIGPQLNHLQSAYSRFNA